MGFIEWLHSQLTEGADTEVVDNGGAARVQVEEGGGTVPIPVDDTGGADNVRVPIAAGGGDGSAQAEEGRDVDQNIADIVDGPCPHPH